jgi:hypothetical protein
MGWLRDVLLGKDNGATPRYGRAQEEPDPIDWSEIENLLVDLSQRSIATFAQKHKKESFYGLGFDCNSSEGQVLLCLNTRELQRAAAANVYPVYSSLPSTENSRIASAEWSFGAWGYHGFNLRQGAWGTAWKSVEARVAASQFMLVTNNRPEAMTSLQEAFMRMAAKALVRVASGTAVDALRRDVDFRVLCMDHDESPEAGFRRLASLRAP